MNMPRIAEIIAWIGGTVFTYVYIVAIGHLRDEGKNWFQALVSENQLLIFGFMGILTLVCLVVF